APGGEAVFREHFRELSADERPAYEGKEGALRQSALLGRMREAISYAVQETQEGYGHAVYCAREFAGDEPVLLMLGDHVYISESEERCARQLLDVFEEHNCPVSGVERTAAAELHLFGTVAGEPVADSAGVYEARAIYEKPTPEYAREHLRTAGLAEETYLCFFGMHVFTAEIFDCLGEHIRDDVRERGEYQLTSAQELLRTRGRYLAAEVNGSRHDMGNPEGLIETQMALARRGPFAGRL
ncbi:MAG: sugar phosphate nucleotidyltransferase, partial [Armatimonadota bacterium]